LACQPTLATTTSQRILCYPFALSDSCQNWMISRASHGSQTEESFDKNVRR